MPASSWWDKSTGFALLTIVLWASLAALTSRITSVSPLVLVGLVLLFCGAGTLPFWRQWRASPLTWLVTITALLLYHLLLFTSFRHAPVLEANLINYLWPLCIILFTPLLLPGHPLSLHHLLAGGQAAGEHGIGAPDDGGAERQQVAGQMGLLQLQTAIDHHQHRPRETQRHLLAGALIMGGALLGLLVKTPKTQPVAEPLS
ncbi:hypothetical protein KAM354_25210 [Aeromonas caviae]|nr:hypothetical protein KAM354_25210 [Aeromonas caviae]